MAAPLVPRKRIKRAFYDVEKGHYGTCYLNGKEVKFITSCKTGENGWVKFWEADGDEMRVAGNGLVVGRARGRVEFVPRQDDFGARSVVGPMDGVVTN